MSITISATQRDLLYDEILNRLAAIDDIHIVLGQQDWDAATQLGITFSDDLRIISQDLGWGPRKEDGPVELTSPPDVLTRAMSRWRDSILGIESEHEDEREALLRTQERNQLVIDACRSVLDALDAEAEQSPTHLP